MISFNEVHAQLESMDNHYRFLGVSEVKQMAAILQPGEQILDCLKGWCDGGVSMLCATDKRMIIVRAAAATKEAKEIAYDAMVDMRHIGKGFRTVLLVETSGARHEFRSWRVKRLKSLAVFVKRHAEYVREQSEAAQEAVRKSMFHTNIRPATTSRNWSVFAKRLGSTSVVR